MKILWVGPETGMRYEGLKKDATLQIQPSLDLGFYLKSEPVDADLALLHPDFYSQPDLHLEFEPESVRSVGFFDCFFKEHGRWVPYCSYRLALQAAFAVKNLFLDSSKVVLVVGDLVEARAAYLELFRMGFRTFRILREKGQKSHWLESQTQSLFGLNISLVEPKELVHFSGEASVLLYGVPAKSGPIFEHELSYLNFLSRPGLIVDFFETSFLAKVLSDTQEDVLSILSRADIESYSLGIARTKSKP